MAGLRIRWRRDDPAIRPLPAALTPSRHVLGVSAFVAISLVFALAAGLRFYNLDWDENTHLHPDERHLTIVANDVDLPGSIAEYFDSASSPLNPYNTESGRSFVYGTLPLFLTKATATLLGLDDYDHLVLVGRYLAALFDLGTVVFAFLLARRLYGPVPGLIAAALYGTAPLAVQHSHFFVVDPFLAFFTTAALYFASGIVRDGGLASYLLAGLALGLGMACKVTGLLVAPVIAGAVLLRLWPYLAPLRANGDGAAQARGAAAGIVVRTLLAAVVAFLAFRIAQPYAFEAPSLTDLALFTIDLDSRWVEDQQNQSRLLGGEVSFPPSVQWIGRQAYLFPLWEMLRWGMGPAFGLAGWLSAVYAGYRLLRFREAWHLLPLIFLAIYFGFMGRQFTLYLRYFLPLYPVLAALAGYGLVSLARHGSDLGRRLRWPPLERLALGAVGLVVVLAALAGLAYASIYSRPVTRVEASRWLYDNLPPRSTIAVEHWDDTVPVRLPGSPDKQFQLVSLSLYDHDTPQKVATLIDQLDEADYVVISSNRLLNSIPRAPFNYPVTVRYYDLLLSGELGFRLLREFTSYPGLLAIELPDHHAEESWSSYDHPRVLVFAKTEGYSRERAETLLGQGPFAPMGLTPKQLDRNGLLLRPDDLEAQRKGGTWTDVFSDSGLAASQPTLLWLAVLQLPALAVTPAVMLLLRRLPDRGYLLAKPLGLLVLGYAVWLIVSLKLVPFSQATVLGVLALLLAVGATTAWLERVDLTAYLRQRWRAILFGELLFLAAFLVLRELRLENPDLWHPYRGGEKPMDLAYLTAVTRSSTLPPYDPWFAGGYINYYYLGQFLTATLSKLTTIPPEITFNLAIPAYFALTCAAAYSVAFNLAATARSLWRRHGISFEAPAWSAGAAGLLGAFFVAVAGNLDAADQLAERLSHVSPWHVEAGVPLLPALINGIGGAWQVIVHGEQLAPFDYWRSSRMLPPTISITEFPYFSFLFADLHAHMMAIPFQLAAVGVALAFALPGERSGRHTDWALALLLALVVGGLRWLNSWDYPPFLLLALAALAIGEREMRGGAGRTTLRLLGKAALLVGASFLLYKPFLDAYQSPATGLHASPETTPLHQYLAHFGILVVLAGGWLAYEAVRAWRSFPAVDDEKAARLREEQAWLWTMLGVTTLFVSLAMLVSGQGFVAVVLPVLALVACLAVRELRLRRPDSGLRLFLLSLVGLALGLSAGVDLVTIDGDINRMNTVFKFYLHVWLLYALLAAFAGWLLLFELLPRALTMRLPRLPGLAVTASACVLPLLLLAAVLYAILATPVRLNDRFGETERTLDGMAYMQHAVYEDQHGPIQLAYDLEGIHWLRENVQGSPVIVEGRADLYRWGGRFSIYTGLPAVVGWDWHQRQQRGELANLVEQRNRDVDAFYGSPDAARALRFLRQYGVRYVILGRLERLYYPEEGLRKLEAGLGGVLQPVFSNQELTIYEVQHEVLAALRLPLP